MGASELWAEWVESSESGEISMILEWEDSPDRNIKPLSKLTT